LNLHEYDSKKRFAEFGIPVPSGEIAFTPEEAYHIAKKMDGAVMVKAQVLVSMRIKKGGILEAKTPGEAHHHAENIIGMNIEGLTVRKVLIEPAVNVIKEIYLGITNDRAARKPVLVASAYGGKDLEDIAHDNPSSIVREHIDPLLGLRHYQATSIANNINLPREHWHTFSELAQALYQCYAESDATLAEINPLVITTENDLLAVDGKMIIDENALYRQKELAALRDTGNEVEFITRARKISVAYVKLDGQIGCLVNGAGLAMATMDIVRFYGGAEIGPANFLDIGGGAKADKVAEAIQLILMDSNVRVMLINIFSGITRGDEAARGIIEAYQMHKFDLPLIVCLQGTNSEIGLALLQAANIPFLIIASSLTDAAQKSVTIIRNL
jgi:succinyl-CoA synthetase beta subunit